LGTLPTDRYPDSYATLSPPEFDENAKHPAVLQAAQLPRPDRDAKMLK
jgi:hypothetical protein